MKSAKYMILGAGPCGLGAAWRFQELGETDFLLLDQETTAGGLARSFEHEGFTWDIGGHVQFSHYEDFDRVMESVLPEQWYEHQRESWVWMKDRFIPYPFQNNIHRLPASDRDLCLSGLRSRPSGESVKWKSFDDWILASFGEGIADLFMRPYNRKVWAFDPTKMNFQWIGERVARVDLERIEENIRLMRDEVSWGPNATFRFPHSGGTGRIWREVAQRIEAQKFALGQRVIAIDPQKRRIRTEQAEFEFERLLSTLPLHRLWQLCGWDLEMQPLYSNSHIVGIGLCGQAPESLQSKCWMYFPEDDCPFYRVTVFSNYSPAHVPDPKLYWSLLCETSESSDKPVDQGKVVEETIAGLLRTGLISSEKEIVSRWHYAARPGYPTPFLGRDDWVRRLQEKLSVHGLDSRGRFGNWFYEVSNQDHSFMQGFEWANAQILSTKEVTAFFPSVVNAPGKREKIPANWIE